jgi:hypothetical protein
MDEKNDYVMNLKDIKKLERKAMDQFYLLLEKINSKTNKRFIIIDHLYFLNRQLNKIEEIIKKEGEGSL